MVYQNPVIDSFYDFIYLDKIRIKTLLGQFSNDSILFNLKNIVEKNGSLVEENTPTIDTELNKSRLDIDIDIEQFFETSWTLPIALLNQMSNKIKKAPSEPIVGDLILISGNLLLLDAPTLKKNLPLIKFILEKKHAINRLDNTTKAGITMTEFLPDTIQLRTKDTNAHKYWMTLDREHFTINIEHLSLKYGSLLNGNWHILCYVDLIPSRDSGSQQKSYGNYFDTEELEQSINQPMLDAFVFNMDVLKEFSGCNNDEYAVTPIMIFKPVN